VPRRWRRGPSASQPGVLRSYPIHRLMDIGYSQPHTVGGLMRIFDLKLERLMSEVMTASIRDQLWHRMRQDLMKFACR
jgi:hypothetical protein